MRRALPFVTAFVLVLVAGCSSSGSSTKSSSSGSPTSAKPTTTTTTSTPSTTSSSAAPSTTGVTATSKPAPEPNGAATPEEAAKGLYGRWVAGDPAGAAPFARQSAIAPLFARSGAGANWTFQSCDGVAGGAYCLFSYTGGGASMHVVDMSVVAGGSVTGFKVDDIQYTAD